MTFLEFCFAAADVGVNCDLDERDTDDDDDDDDDAPSAGTKRKGGSVGGSAKKKQGSTRPGSSSPQAKSPSCTGEHQLAPISSVKGWEGQAQQRCGVCGVRCGWYCVQCSAPQIPHAMKPVHPEEVRYTGYSCLKVHTQNPQATKWRMAKGKQPKRESRKG